MGSIERLAPTLPVSVPPPPALLRGHRYGEDRLYLFARDPRSVLAVWEITQALHEQALLHADSRDTLGYRLRIERRNKPEGAASPAAEVDLPDAVGGESWYVAVPEAGGECRASIGYYRMGTFEPVLHSDWIALPPDHPCAEEGTWDLTPEARAWLLERARAAEPGSAISSIARFLAPVERTP